MHKITALFFSISITFSSVHTSEQRSFNWKVYVPSSTVSTVWPFNSTPIWVGLSAICASVLLNGRGQKAQQEAAHKKELLYQLRKYVHAANGDLNQFGSADDMAILAATDPVVVKLLPGELSNNYNVKIRQDGVLGRRIKYLRSSEIWGEVEKALREENKDAPCLKAEADEWNRFRSLRAELPQLLAPIAQAMCEEMNKQSKSSRNFVKTEDPEGKDGLHVDHEWQLSPDTWHTRWIKQGLESLGLKLLAEQYSTELFDEYWNNGAAVWKAAQEIARAQEKEELAGNLQSLAQQQEKKDQAKSFEAYKPLEFKEFPGATSASGLIYDCDVGTHDISQVHAIDPTEFFYSSCFSTIGLDSEVSVNFNDRAMQLKVKKKKGLLSSFSVDKFVDDKVCTWVSHDQCDGNDSRLQQINRKVLDTYYRNAQKKNIEQLVTQKKFATVVARNAETKFVEPWVCPWYLYYPCALIWGNGVALSTGWFKSNVKSQDFYEKQKDEEAARINRAQEYRNTYAANLSRLQRAGINFESVLTKCAELSQPDTLVEVVHNLSEALDSFNKLIKDDKPCAAIQARRKKVLAMSISVSSTTLFDDYLKNKAKKNDVDVWKKENNVLDREEYYFKAFYNVHEQLARAGKAYADCLAAQTQSTAASSSSSSSSSAVSPVSRLPLFDYLETYGVNRAILNNVFDKER